MTEASKSGAKHTPGPWGLKAASGARSLWRVADAVGRVIGTISRPYTGVDRADADARLIAAAPELLAALELLTDRMALVPDHEDAILAAARAAIAKALGGAP